MEVARDRIVAGIDLVRTKDLARTAVRFMNAAVSAARLCSTS